jgi:hypothetical protein
VPLAPIRYVPGTANKRPVPCRVGGSLAVVQVRQGVAAGPSVTGSRTPERGTSAGYMVPPARGRTRPGALGDGGRI